MYITLFLVPRNDSTTNEEFKKYITQFREKPRVGTPPKFKDKPIMQECA